MKYVILGVNSQHSCENEIKVLGSQKNHLDLDWFVIE